MTDQSQPQTRRVGNLVAAIAAIACCDIAMGLTFQLLPLLMDRAHFHAWLIGLNTATAPIGTLLTGPFVPALVSRIGSRRLVAIVTVTIALLLAGFKLAPSIWWWFPLRFVFGAATSMLFTVSEAWVLTFSDDGSRGRVVGIFTSVMAVTFAVGPLILPLTGITGWMPWAIGIGCCALSAIPLAFVQVAGDHFEEKKPWGYFRFFVKAPMLLMAVAAATLFDSVFIAFFTIFGLRHGLSLELASWILGFGIIGNVLMFYPMGWLADHWSRSGVIVVTAVATIGLALTLAPAIGSWAIWPVAVLITGCAFGVYVVAMSALGDHFQGADLVAGSAAIGAMWGVGGLVGPPLAGAMIDRFGIDAMPLTLAGFYVVLLLALAASRGRLVRAGAQAS